MVQSDLSAINSHLIALYGQSAGEESFERLRVILERYGDFSRHQNEGGDDTLSERDMLLITYADQLSEPDTHPLQTLSKFCEQTLTGSINSIHILPFFPYSSDDGFSVSDYRAVNPAFGNWEDIARLGSSFRLMFDAVINHVSVQHEWFQAFLK